MDNRPAGVTGGRSTIKVACAAGVAQWLERLTVTQEAAGSSPVIRPISSFAQRILPGSRLGVFVLSASMEPCLPHWRLRVFSTVIVDEFMIELASP